MSAYSFPPKHENKLEITVSPYPLGEAYISNALMTPVSIVCRGRMVVEGLVQERLDVMSQIEEENLLLEQTMQKAKDETEDYEEYEDPRKLYGEQVMFVGSDGMPKCSVLQLEQESLILRARNSDPPPKSDATLSQLLEEQRQMFIAAKASQPAYQAVTQTAQKWHNERKKIVQNEITKAFLGHRALESDDCDED